MNIKTIVLLFASHLSIGALGVAIGIYILPILIAPPAPSEAMISELSSQAKYTARFKKDLQDSDSFHWGDGQVAIDSKNISFMGKLAPGPDYKLYLSNEFVETEVDFNRLKSTMVKVGEVTTFENFVVPVAENIDVSQYRAVIVWCETFGEFITAAQYK